MSQKQATQRRWIVHRTFEPDRLSSTILVQAYAHLVPPHIRVLRLPAALLELEGGPDTPQIPWSDPAKPKIAALTGSPSQRQDTLVIEPITKKEVC